jgi:tRNA pseudouridine38-40 synthase
VKELRQLEIVRHGDVLVFQFAADAFLHHMVRNIVGSLVRVGSHRRAAQWVRTVLESRDRAQAAPTFGASGLYLTAVEYDAGWGLPQASVSAEQVLIARLGVLSRP